MGGGYRHRRLGHGRRRRVTTGTGRRGRTMDVCRRHPSFSRRRIRRRLQLIYSLALLSLLASYMAAGGGVAAAAAAAIYMSMVCGLVRALIFVWLCVCASVCSRGVCKEDPDGEINGVSFVRRSDFCFGLPSSVCCRSFSSRCTYEGG